MINEKSTLNGSDIQMAACLINYLKANQVPFDHNGFPVFKAEWFMSSVPEEMVPFYHRSKCRNKQKTCICFNSPDEDLYPRISSVFSDISTYKEYMGVGPMDISVSRYMLLEVQNFNLLLNALFLATLGLNGIKIAAPIRYGSIETIPLFDCYKDATIYQVGSIGTKPLKHETASYENYEYELFNFLIIRNRKIKLLIYGNLSRGQAAAWKRKGVAPYGYLDYHARSKKGEI